MGYELVTFLTGKRFVVKCQTIVTRGTLNLLLGVKVPFHTRVAVGNFI